MTNVTFATVQCPEEMQVPARATVREKASPICENSNKNVADMRKFVKTRRRFAKIRLIVADLKHLLIYQKMSTAEIRLFLQCRFVSIQDNFSWKFVL